MKRSVLAGAVVLLIGAALIAVRPSADVGGTRASGDEARKAVGTGSKSQRDRQGKPPTPAEAFRRLRSFIGAGPAGAPNFEELDALAPRVRSDDLWQLIDASLHDAGWSLGAWVRLAALAELGRRDPEVTLARLAGRFTDKDYKVLHPALFSVFRGWSEVDPAAAAARLGATEGDFQLSRFEGFEEFGFRFESWRGEAYAVVFEALARIDPERAHQSLPPHLPPEGFFIDPFDYRGHAWEGLFAGLDDPEKIEEFLHIWRDEGLPEMQISAGGPAQSFESHSNVPFAAMISLAGINNELPERIRSGSNREFPIEVGLANMFGQRHPDRALELIRDGAPNHQWLALGVMWAYPERALAVVHSLPDSAIAGEVIYRALRGRGTDLSHPGFPAPGRNNRLPDFAAHYRHFEAAIEAAALDPAQRTGLIARLNAAVPPSQRPGAPPSIPKDP